MSAAADGEKASASTASARHVLFDQPGEAPDEGAGLAGPGAAEDEERAAGVGHGGLLRAVQAVEGLRHPRLGYAASCSAPTRIGWPSAAVQPTPPARWWRASRRRAERGLETGRGEGGDTALVIDRAAEDAVFGELEALGVGLVAVSEERGEVPVHGGGPVRVVIDPVDGSLNAKRRLPSACVSIAVASGPLDGRRGGGLRGRARPRARLVGRARRGGFCGESRLDRLEPGPLEVLGLETARPARVAAQVEAIAATEAHRLRILGAVATSLCLVAAGRIDAMVTMGEVRSVDVAAAQLLVYEAGGALALPGRRRPGPADALTRVGRARPGADGAPAALLCLDLPSAFAHRPTAGPLLKRGWHGRRCRGNAWLPRCGAGLCVPSRRAAPARVRPRAPGPRASRFEAAISPVECDQSLPSRSRGSRRPGPGPRFQ